MSKLESEGMKERAVGPRLTVSTMRANKNMMKKSVELLWLSWVGKEG
jgi:hypothetical protein